MSSRARDRITAGGVLVAASVLVLIVLSAALLAVLSPSSSSADTGDPGSVTIPVPSEAGHYNSLALDAAGFPVVTSYSGLNIDDTAL